MRRNVIAALSLAAFALSAAAPAVADVARPEPTAGVDWRADPDGHRDALARNDRLGVCHSQADDSWFPLGVRWNDSGRHITVTSVGGSDHAELRLAGGDVEIRVGDDTNGVYTGYVLTAENGSTDSAVLRVRILSDC